MFSYVRNIFFAIHYHKGRSFWYRLDVVVNAVFGGDPRETISSRVGKAVADGWNHVNDLLAWPLCFLLGLVDQGHCAQSVHDELGGKAVGFFWFFLSIIIGGFAYGFYRVLS